MTDPLCVQRVRERAKLARQRHEQAADDWIQSSGIMQRLLQATSNKIQISIECQPYASSCLCTIHNDEINMCDDKNFDRFKSIVSERLCKQLQQRGLECKRSQLGGRGYIRVDIKW